MHNKQKSISKTYNINGLKYKYSYCQIIYDNIKHRCNSSDDWNVSGIPLQPKDTTGKVQQMPTPDEVSILEDGSSLLSEINVSGGTIDKAQFIADPSNDFLSIVVAQDARFNSGATGIVTGLSYNISYNWRPVCSGTPATSFTTIKIDEVNNVYGSSGTIIQTPIELPDLKNESIWQYGNILVKQTLQIVNNIATGRFDTGMYKYIVTNKDNVAHSVGIRIMVDTTLDDYDYAPFLIPKVGAVTDEMEFIGSDIPQYWQSFYSLANPDILAQGTLIGGGATTPDRFIIAYWWDICVTEWDYIVDPLKSILYDSAVAVYWNPVVISPGESHEFITYYGLGTLNGNVDLSTTGPVELFLINNEWSPNPFLVTAYITNTSTSPMSNVSVTLSLSFGLALAPGETAIHIIPSINPGDIKQTSWSVIALVDGTLTYLVTALEQTVPREITVPPKRQPITEAKVMLTVYNCLLVVNNQSIDNHNKVFLKSGNPVTEIVKLPVVPGIIGTPITVSSVSINSSCFHKPQIKLDFIINITIPADVLITNLTFQVFKSCCKNSRKIPVGPQWIFKKSSEEQTTFLYSFLYLIMKMTYVKVNIIDTL